MSSLPRPVGAAMGDRREWNAAHFTSDACYDSSFSNSINENLLTRAGLLT